MAQKFEKYWLGKCIDIGTTYNLEVGKIYLLKDKTGKKNHFYVSKFISNNDSFLGAYRAAYFEVLEDVTEAINSMEYEKGTQQYDTMVGIVRMVARERGMSFIKAQEYLIDKGTISKPVVDSDGNPLKQHAIIYEPEKVREPDFTLEKPKPKEAPKETPAEINEIGVTTVRVETSQPTKVNTPKTAEKLKLVQKGLFGNLGK